MMVSNTGKEMLHGFIARNVTYGSTVYTDDHRSYLGLDPYRHESVNHSIGEYVRGNAHTNGIESFWVLLKRVYYGVFHHFTWKHLERYLAEFETRCNMAELDVNECLDSFLEYVSGNRLPFFGSGNTAIAAEACSKDWIGIDISKDYCKVAKERIKAARGLFRK